MDVRLVSVTTSDGVRLEGALRTATTGAADLGLDLVICHHGVGGNFAVPSFYDPMGDELLGHGTAVLRVNNRGHDQAWFLGTRRLGAAYEVIDDCRHDWKAWLDFAEQQGYRRIAVWGHSLGAVKTIYDLSVEPDARVVCALASSPPRFSHAAYMRSKDRERFAADIHHAQSLVDAGQPEALLEALIPQNRPFSARTYLDKYGANARYDYFQHLPNTRMPLLVTLGGLETPDVSFAPLAEHGPTFKNQWPNIGYAQIDGADHFYRDRTTQLWSAVQQWLQQVVAAPVA